VNVAADEDARDAEVVDVASEKTVCDAASVLQPSGEDSDDSDDSDGEQGDANSRGCFQLNNVEMVDH